MNNPPTILLVFAAPEGRTFIKNRSKIGRGGVWGASWESLGGYWERLGSSWGRLGGLQGRLGRQDELTIVFLGF